MLFRSLDALREIALKPLTYDLTEKGFKDGEGNPVTGGTSTQSGYITVRLVFRSSTAMKIYLNDDSSVTPALLKGEEIEGEENNSTLELKNFTFRDSELGKKFGDKIINTAAGYGADATEDYVNGAESGDRTFTIKARAANAARVMFEEKKASGATAIWSPNEYYTSGKQAVMGSTDGDNVDEEGNPIERGFCYGNFASDYNYLKKAAIEDAMGNPTLIAGLDPANNNTNVTQADYTAKALTKGESGTLIATTTDKKADWAGGGYITGSGYFAVVDVTFWLEGTDGDCIDSILGDKLSVLLNFKGVEVA